MAEGELSPDSVVREFRITAADGKTDDTQRLNFFALFASLCGH